MDTGSPIGSILSEEICSKNTSRKEEMGIKMSKKEK